MPPALIAAAVDASASLLLPTVPSALDTAIAAADAISEMPFDKLRVRPAAANVLRRDVV